MKNDTRAAFGNYLRDIRQERKLSIRELGRKSGIDPSAITRLEQGQWSPHPETIKALAPALGVSTGDLLAAAGYFTLSDLPNISTYLRICYGELSDQAIASIEAYIGGLVDEHKLDPNGPAPFEDELTAPTKE